MSIKIILIHIVYPISINMDFFLSFVNKHEFILSNVNGQERNIYPKVQILNMNFVVCCIVKSFTQEEARHETGDGGLPCPRGQAASHV
jgi:hypothetical protein